MYFMENLRINQKVKGSTRNFLRGALDVATRAQTDLLGRLLEPPQVLECLTFVAELLGRRDVALRQNIGQSVAASTVEVHGRTRVQTALLSIFFFLVFSLRRFARAFRAAFLPFVVAVRSLPWFSLPSKDESQPKRRA